MRRLLAAGLAVAPEGLLRRAAGLRRRSPALARAVRRASAVDSRIRRGEAAGLRFNTFGTNAGYLTGTKELEIERSFTALLAPGAVVYDLGGAVGYYTVIAARKVGPTGRVIAFEPLPANQEHLRHNVALNDFTHVECLGIAVGETAGRAQLQLGRAHTQGRLAELPGTPASVGVGTIDVEVAAIDDLIGAGRIPPPSVMKIDIEGAEVEALRGAAATLRDHRPALLMEMHGRAAEVAASLEPLGYRASIVGQPGRPLRSAPWSCHVIAT